MIFTALVQRDLETTYEVIENQGLMKILIGSTPLNFFEKVGKWLHLVSSTLI